MFKLVAEIPFILSESYQKSRGLGTNGYSTTTITPRLLLRVVLAGEGIRRREAFSIFVAIGGDFEIAIQRKSHLSGSSDEILPTEKIKVPHKCILVMHALLRHGGLSGHGRLHVYLSTSNPLDNDGGGGTTCTNFGF